MQDDRKVLVRPRTYRSIVDQGLVEILQMVAEKHERYDHPIDFAEESTLIDGVRHQSPLALEEVKSRIGVHGGESRVRSAKTRVGSLAQRFAINE